MVIKCQAYALHYCWLGRSMLHAGINRLTWDWRIIPFGTERGWEGFTHWLPADVRYLPAAEE